MTSILAVCLLLAQRLNAGSLLRTESDNIGLLSSDCRDRLATISVFTMWLFYDFSAHWRTAKIACSASSGVAAAAAADTRSH